MSDQIPAIRVTDPQSRDSIPEAGSGLDKSASPKEGN